MIKSRRCFFLLLIASFSTIAVATIFPANFVTPKSLYLPNILDKFYYTANIKDYIRNIILFIPLGISFAGTIAKRKYQAWQIIIASLSISLILSSSIETIQLLLPSRVSSFSDITFNTAGGILGASIYCWRQDFCSLIHAFGRNQYQQVNLRFVTIIIIGYCLTIFWAIYLLLNNINLSNWNDDYRLAIGSEVTGKITWQGYITSLYISDRSLKQPEIAPAFNQTHSFFTQLSSLVAGFTFLDYQEFYQDYAQQTSNLVWQTKPVLNAANYIKPLKIDSFEIDNQIQRQTKVLFKRNQSLISQLPLLNLNQKIKQSNQFTISLIVATDYLKQVGPARIISLADDVSQRNIMIGQEGKNLLFRLRTPTTGQAANQPEFIIPNVFTDYDLHQIIITFAHRKLSFYIDQPDHQYTYEFRPSTSAMLYLPWTTKRWRVNLKNFNLLESQLIFYGVVLMPLAILGSILIAGYQQDN